MSLLLGRIVLLLLMAGSFACLMQRKRWFLVAGSLLLGATFAWAFYLGSAMVLQAAVLRI